MNCKRIREMALDYISGRLEAAQDEAVQLHLVRCENCSSFVSELEATDKLLRMGFAATDEGSAALPPDAMQKIHEKISNMKKTARSSHAKRMSQAPARRSWVPWALAAAAAFLIAIVFYVISQPQPSYNVVKKPAGGHVPDDIAAPGEGEPKTPAVVKKPADIPRKSPEDKPRGPEVGKDQPEAPQRPPEDQPQTPKVVKELPQKPVKDQPRPDEGTKKPTDPPDMANRKALAVVDTVEEKLTVGGKTIGKGESIYPGSRVETGIKGRARLILADQSEMYLNAGTQITFDKEDAPLTLHQGEIFARMQKQTKPFVVKTAHGETQVKGTEFSVRVNGSKTLVSVTSGKVECRTDRGSVEVSAGQETSLTPGGSPVATAFKESPLAWTRGLQPELFWMRTEFFRATSLDAALWETEGRADLISLKNGLVLRNRKKEGGTIQAASRFYLTGDLDIQIEFQVEGRSGLSKDHYLQLGFVGSDAKNNFSVMHNIRTNYTGRLRLVRTGSTLKGYFSDKQGEWRELKTADDSKGQPFRIVIGATLQHTTTFVTVRNLSIVRGEFVWKP